MRPLSTSQRAPLLFAGILGLILVQRVPLYRDPGAFLGWNSDAAIHGLMARTMVQDGTPVFLFWGQDYLGSTTALWTVVGSLFAGSVGPLALRIGMALQLAVVFTLAWFAFRAAWGAIPATLAVVWLTSGPRYFFEQTTAPVSAEAMVFVGILVLWFVTRVSMVRAWHWLVLGLLAGLGWWAHRGATFAVLSAALAALWFEKARFRSRLLPIAVVCFSIGAAVGLVPVFLGRLQINQYLYEPETPGFTPLRIPARLVETLSFDFPAFLGESSIVLVVLFVLGLTQVRWRREDATLLGTLVVSFAFWILSPQAYSGATRYLSLALPVFLAVSGLGVLSLWQKRFIVARVLAVGLALYAAANYTVARAIDVRAIAAGEREQYERWPGGFDPRPVLRQIEIEQYRVCYADFWIAYKLEWLSTSGVQFIPYASVNRTQRRSVRLAAAPVRKCFVSRDARVEELSAAREAFFRDETMAAIARYERKRHR